VSNPLGYKQELDNRSYFTVDGDKIPIGYHINHDGNIVPDDEDAK